jgi:hypothetical protein
LEEMAIIHDEHCHAVEHKKTGDSGMRNNGKGNDASWCERMQLLRHAFSLPTGVRQRFYTSKGVVGLQTYEP